MEIRSKYMYDCAISENLNFQISKNQIYIFNSI